METLKHGYYTRDPALLAGIYSDDVKITVCNRNNPPDKRLVLRGRAAARKMLDDLGAREMTHSIGHITLGEGSIALSFPCISATYGTVETRIGCRRRGL